MKRDPSKPVTFGPPQVSPGLAGDPIAERTRRGMESRGRIPPNAYNTPIGGGNSPPIPRLDLPAVEGSTMADQARGQRMPPPGPAVAAASGFMARDGAPPDSSFQKPAPARGPNILPADLLPEVARSDPAFREGQGSMYASSQPELALKYGVIRNKQPIPPQQLLIGTSVAGKLKPETIEGLKAVVDFQKTRAGAESENDSVEAASSASAAGAAARMGQTSSEKPLTEVEREKMKNVAQNMDDFDWHTLREMMMKDLLNNEEQRKLIEERLQPMDLSDYVSNGFVEQRVTINSKLEYTLRSVDGTTDLALKRLVVKEAKGFALDDRYILDKYAIMGMACALTAINRVPLPDYLDEKGDFSDDKFWIKFNKVCKLGLHILASVGINSFWFDMRVRKLLVAESLTFG